MNSAMLFKFFSISIFSFVLLFNVSTDVLAQEEGSGLFQDTSAAASQPDINEARCEAISINGQEVANGGSLKLALQPGFGFSAQVKMKNLGERVWTPVSRYKLGSPNDNYVWNLNRVDLPTGSNVAKNETVIFAFNPKLPASITSAGAKFEWQMLRESAANDPGGRFGQVCSITILPIYLPTTVDSPALTTDPNRRNNPELCPKAKTAAKNIQTGECTVYETPCDVPNSSNIVAGCQEQSISTSSVCSDIQKGTQKVSAKWQSYTGKWVRVFLKDVGKSNAIGAGILIDSSACLGDNVNSFTFGQEVASDTSYKVALMPYLDNSCSRFYAKAPSGGYFTDVINGGNTYPRPNDPSVFQIKSIFLDFGDGERSKINTESCGPTKFLLKMPTGKSTLSSFDVPVNILLTRFTMGTNGVIQRNDINTNSTVIMRYRPVLTTGEGEKIKVLPPSPSPKTQEPSDYRPEEGGNSE